MMFKIAGLIAGLAVLLFLTVKSISHDTVENFVVGFLLASVVALVTTGLFFVVEDYFTGGKKDD